MTNFRTRLPELKFAVDEATVLSVLTEWVRDTYELAAREYSLEFVKSAIDNQYHVTATFIDAPVRRPVSFEEIAAETEHNDTTPQARPFPPFTIATFGAASSSQNTDSDTNVTEEPGRSDNGVPSAEV